MFFLICTSDYISIYSAPDVRLARAFEKRYSESQQPARKKVMIPVSTCEYAT